MVLAPRSRFTLEDFQRSSDENKQIWWSFADSQGSGRDPAWYEEGLLQAFLAEHGTTVFSAARSRILQTAKSSSRSRPSSDPPARRRPGIGGRRKGEGSQHWTPTEAVSSRRQFGAFQVWAQELIGNKHLFRTVRLAASIIDIQIIPAQGTFECSCYASDWAPGQDGSDCIGYFACLE